jgi:DDE superfamily endonuclease
MDDRSAPPRAQAHRAPRGGRRGQRPHAVVQHRYQWGSLYAFVPPPCERTIWLLLPTVSIMAFTLALAESAQAVGAGSDQQILLVLDGAGWHGSPQVQVPVGWHRYFVPPYSPELQPAARLWPLTNEPLANRHFRDLDERQDVQIQRCLTLPTMPRRIRAQTNFHWWPQLA